MTAAETGDFEAYLADRRRRDPRGPLFGVERPDGRVAPFSRVALGAICAEALRRASGRTICSSCRGRGPGDGHAAHLAAIFLRCRV